MTPKAKTVTAVLLLALLALPTGLCSLFFTPVGIGSLFSHDSLDRHLCPDVLGRGLAGVRRRDLGRGPAEPHGEAGKPACRHVAAMSRSRQHPDRRSHA
jgi:hypothetical protein